MEVAATVNGGKYSKMSKHIGTFLGYATRASVHGGVKHGITNRQSLLCA